MKVRQGGDLLWLSEELTGILKEKGEFEVIEKVAGKALVGLSYRGPFDDLEVPGATTDALGAVSFELRRGQIMAIVGANGSGKSLTLRIAHGLLRAASGEVRWGEGAAPSLSTPR